MHIERDVDRSLLEWKNDPLHKPLMLHGARQTGKTTAIRNLGKKFDNYVELNFDLNADLRKIFGANLDATEICAKIEAMTGKSIEPGKTLLFFDEVQSCPRAISALRYFYENKQELHVVAAGSLLEFAFSEISDFGVGRVRHMYMHPLGFAEFARATGAGRAYDLAMECGFRRPVPEPVHGMLMDVLKRYCIVGGMPAAVAGYMRRGSFLDAQAEQGDILASLKADFGKYKKRISPELVRTVYRAVVNQVGEKFTYTDAEAGVSYRQSKECTCLLEKARLVKRVELCHANGIPMGADIDMRGNKFLFLDTGLYMRESGLEISGAAIDTSAEFVNRGKLAEMFVGLELMKAGAVYDDGTLYYWRREARGACAEVDYLVQFGGAVIPLEVKSGVRGSMRSLRMLMEAKGMGLGLRASAENFGEVDAVKIIPLYLAGRYPELLKAESR